MPRVSIAPGTCARPSGGAWPSTEAADRDEASLGLQAERDYRAGTRHSAPGCPHAEPARRAAREAYGRRTSAVTT
jgi:hypothetical protein